MDGPVQGQKPRLQPPQPRHGFILLLVTCIAPAQLQKCLISTSHFLKTFVSEKHERGPDSGSGRTPVLRSRNNPNHVNHAVPRTAVAPAESAEIKRCRGNLGSNILT